MLYEVITHYDGAHAIMGAFDSGQTMAAAQVAEQKNIPFICNIAAVPALTGPQAAVQDRELVAETAAQTGEDLMGEADFGNHHERLSPGAKPYTFCLDPIDGTDAFSQSMAGWCTSLALLDETLTPVAGIIYAPKLDVMLFASYNFV